MAWIDRLNQATALALCVATLGGCSVMGPRGSPLPQDGPDMLSVYRGHMASEGQDADAIRERIPRRSAEDDQLRTQRRTDVSSLQQRFQRLPNPDLVMSVFPHLAKGRYPVPGYVTVFPMYETVEYAMPGEVSGRFARNDEIIQSPPPVAPRARQPALQLQPSPKSLAKPSTGAHGCGGGEC